MTVVLDASALIAFLLEEPGAEVVAQHLSDALVSSVNMTEVVAKLVDLGQTSEEITLTLRRLGSRIVPFDAAQALAAGLLRHATRAAGLSVGDRACLVLAGSEGLPAVTADRAWAGLDHGVEVEVIR